MSSYFYSSLADVYVLFFSIKSWFPQLLLDQSFSGNDKTSPGISPTLFWTSVTFLLKENWFQMRVYCMRNLMKK